MNRTHMTEDAKRAAKIEKKLKVLLGGYQVGIKCFYALPTYLLSTVKTERGVRMRFYPLYVL